MDASWRRREAPSPRANLSRHKQGHVRGAQMGDYPMGPHGWNLERASGTASAAAALMRPQLPQKPRGCGDCAQSPLWIPAIWSKPSGGPRTKWHETIYFHQHFRVWPGGPNKGRTYHRDCVGWRVWPTNPPCPWFRHLRMFISEPPIYTHAL